MKVLKYEESKNRYIPIECQALLNILQDNYKLELDHKIIKGNYQVTLIYHQFPYEIRIKNDYFPIFQCLIKYNKNIKKYCTPLKSEHEGNQIIDNIRPIIFITEGHYDMNKESKDYRLSFFDSSCWFRIVNIHDVVLEKELRQKERELQNLIEETHQFYDKYARSQEILNSCAEFYIKSIREISIAHSLHEGHRIVSKFNSESNQQKLYNSKLKSLRDHLGPNVSCYFKILIFDDKHEKHERIESLLKKYVGEIIFIFENAYSQADAIDAINKESFDLILVDYNIDDSTYGTEFINDLIGKRYPDAKPGPFNKHWFMPISIFSDTMIDDLRNNNIGFVSEKYYLSRGADPINTPHLFLNNLVEIISVQMKMLDDYSVHSMESGLKEYIRMYDNIENGRKSQSHNSSIGSMKTDEELKESKTGMLRAEARSEFLKILGRDIQIQNFTDLRNNYKDGEGFASTALQKLDPSKIDFILHYRNLLYNLSYESFHNNEDLIMEMNLAQYYLRNDK